MYGRPQVPPSPIPCGLNDSAPDRAAIDRAAVDGGEYFKRGILPFLYRPPQPSAGLSKVWTSSGGDGGGLATPRGGAIGSLMPARPADAGGWVSLGVGRIVTSQYSSTTLYQIFYHIQ